MGSGVAGAIKSRGGKSIEDKAMGLVRFVLFGQTTYGAFERVAHEMIDGAHA
jgi:O-acetyl-ADP-ribose deacetylase (regulator of RNase III)